MRDLATNLDDYLWSRFGVTLERVVADATSGVVTLVTARRVEIVADLIGSLAYEDAGLTEEFVGTMALEGVTYRFTCTVFTDGGGSRFIESIDELEIVEWGVRLAMPWGSAEAG